MNPEVAKLKRLDVYRDGGSLSISFSDIDNQAFTLLFKVDLSKEEISSDLKFYKCALLESFTERSYTSPVTHDTMPLSPDVRRKPISWKEALAILQEARQLVGQIDSTYKWVLQAMVEVAEGDGLRQA